MRVVETANDLVIRCTGLASWRRLCGLWNSILKGHALVVSSPIFKRLPMTCPFGAPRRRPF